MGNRAVRSGARQARLTREQSRANTRERLLARRAGCSRAAASTAPSVEEIASEAGFSTGALYSNFGGKEDLFLALMEREIEEHAREIADGGARAGTRSPSARRAGRASG